MNTHNFVPDHVVRARVRAARVLLKDAHYPVEPDFIKWVRTIGTKQLAALVRNPLNGSRWLVGLDNRTNSVRVLARV